MPALSTTVSLLIAVALPQLAGILGAWATASSVESWYPTLTKPWFTPPNWLFAPAWITLYLLMGIASWMIWRQGFDQRAVRWALGVYGLQLLLNAGWSPAFFGAQSLGLGLAVIIPLWLAIVATIVLFWRIVPLAGALLIPYLGWVTYATALNLRLWQLN